MSRAATWGLLLLLAAIYTWRIDRLPMKWEEPRRSLVAMEMLHSGDWVTPTILGERYVKKPPGQNWLIAAASLGDPARIDALTVRAISVAALLGTAGLLWSLEGGLAALLFATFGISIQVGRAGEIDMLFTFFVTAAFASFEWGRRRERPFVRDGVSQLFVAAGVLTKWIAPLFFYPPLLIWMVRRRAPGRAWSGLVAGALVASIPVGLWFLPFRAAGGAGETGRRWGTEILRRTVDYGVEGLAWQVVTYPLFVFAALAPWSLLLPGLRRERARRALAHPWYSLCILAALWALAVFFFVPEQKSRYLLPVFPLVAVVLARLASSGATRVPPAPLVALSLVYGIVWVTHAESREAERGAIYPEAAALLARAVDDARPVVGDRRLSLLLYQPLTRELGRPLVRRAPAGTSAWWVSKPGLSAIDPGPPAALSPPGGRTLRDRGFGVWDLPPPEAWSLLAEPLYPPSLDDAVRREREEKRAEARRRLDADPGDLDARIWLGRRTAYLGEYRAAIEIFDEGVAREPADPRPLRHRGHRFITVRELDAAIRDLEHASRMVEGRPDAVEPDGLPNARNVPTSTLQTNIWYHLGLARYLAGDPVGAERAYRRCLALAKNPDMKVATLHWLSLSLLRQGRTREAQDVVSPVAPDWDVIENHAYHETCLMFRGALSPDEVLERARARSGASFSSAAYAVAAVHLAEGERGRALAVIEEILARGNWPAFGYIAAEADLVRVQDRAL